MKQFTKKTSLFMVFLLLLFSTMPFTYASSDIPISTNISESSTTSEFISITEECEDVDLDTLHWVPIGTIEVTDQTLGDTDNNITRATTYKTDAYAIAIRSKYDSTQVQIYIGFVGNMPVRSVKFSSLVVKSTSVFGPTYVTFGSQELGCSGSIAGTVFVGYATVPTTVSKVTIKSSNAQVYVIFPGHHIGWLSVAGLQGGSVNLN